MHFYISMVKKEHPAFEQIKSYLWILILFEYVIFCLGILFGRTIGYKETLLISLIFGLFVASCFLIIIFLNWIGILIYKVFVKIIVKDKEHKI